MCRELRVDNTERSVAADHERRQFVVRKRPSEPDLKGMRYGGAGKGRRAVLTVASQGGAVMTSCQDRNLGTAQANTNLKSRLLLQDKR